MKVSHTLQQKRREKQMLYERKVLRELSLVLLKDRVKQSFLPFFVGKDYKVSTLEDGCMDIAIESFLLGARFSHFGYRGEEERAVNERCLGEQKLLTNALYEYVTFWSPLGQSSMSQDGIYYTCERFVYEWWRDGFDKGKKRYLLRLK
ncbi:DUF2521 family protein [Priestia koreensis]|uniref:DUF2521 family protein n=1 Tax=Priestia koreensis TaxID=284581 RepID=UPI00203B64E6|nr:DUF2521 family protein [Priestia koreensis]MCM3006733.1 YbaK family protein [Priestia koreensis]